MASGLDATPDVFRLLFERHPEPMWIYDLDTLGFLEVNHAAVDRYGYSREDFARMTIRDIRPSAELARLDTDLSTPRPELQRAGTWQHLHRDGSVLHVEITSHTLTYAGRPAALVIASDVTRRVEAEDRSEQLVHEAAAARDALDVQTRNFDVMFEQMADPVMLFDARGRIDRINRAARAIFSNGLQVVPGTVSGRDLAERFRLRDEHGVSIPCNALPVMRVLRGELLTGASAFDAQVGPRSSPILLNITGAPIRDRAGQIIGAVMVSRDVTDRRRLEQQAQAALRQLNQRMEAFLSLAGHEMRTPLTSLLGNIQLAERSLDDLESTPAMPPVQLRQLRRLIVRMERQARLLNVLVNNVLDASAADSRGLALDNARFDMLDVVEEALLDARAPMRGRSIELEVGAERPLVVDGDRERIGQVVSHFLTNAHKFSPLEEPVQIAVSRDRDSVEVSVADHGPGVPVGERDRIWDRFYRIDGLGHISGSSIGLGLGLYLGRTIIERHGGSVGLDDPEGGGARFWFRLPLATPSADVRPAEPSRTGDLARR